MMADPTVGHFEGLLRWSIDLKVCCCLVQVTSSFLFALICPLCHLSYVVHYTESKKDMMDGGVGGNYL